MRNQKCKLGFGREFHDAKCKLYQYVKIQDLKYKFDDTKYKLNILRMSIAGCRELEIRRKTS